MDPLSIGASVITVVGVTRKFHLVLKQFEGLQRAPQGLDDLLAEISRFERLLQAIRKAPYSSDDADHNLTALLNEATKTLTEFKSLVVYRLTKSGESNKVDRWQWTRSENYIGKLKDSLRDIRANLIA